MKKPRKTAKPPVKSKGGGPGGKGGGGGGAAGSGKPQGWKSGHKGIVPHHKTTTHHHATAAPHHHAGAHHPHQAPAPKKPPKKRHWSPGWDAECCVAEAIGRILGLSDSDILELHAASDQTIPGTLDVISGRARPDPGGLILGVALPEPHAVAVIDGVWWSWGEPFDPYDWPELVIEEAWVVGEIMN